MNRYLFVYSIIFIAVLTGCSSLRKYGTMNFENEVTGMIHFKSGSADKITERLERDFGNYVFIETNGNWRKVANKEKTEYKQIVIWRNVVNWEWSDTLMKIQLIQSHRTGQTMEFVGISVVDYHGVVLTDKRSDKLQSIKNYIYAISR